MLGAMSFVLSDTLPFNSQPNLGASGSLCGLLLWSEKNS